MDTQIQYVTVAPPIGVCCPYLGLVDDPTTRCAFVTESHRCHRPPRPIPITASHQLSYCLDGAFQRCPVFAGAQPDRATPGRRVPHAAWIGGALLVIAVLAAGVGAVRRPFGDGAAGVLSVSDLPRPAAVAPATASATVPASPVPVPAATRPSATPPALLPYRVREGDTLTAIAQFCGATIEDMIKLNRLPQNGTILVGQEILVPCVP